ncbi:MAG: pknA 4 [Acidobacteria bacterium]|nr:pknA 4 [Acidobacteriota bacterium]
MPLSIGSRLGPYDIVAPLGAGGMGEVYRARDTKLNRDVAIKVLLAAVANDPDRLARFNREAQVLASLNHANIAHIHGLEEADGVTALVLELVEGEDLAQRIARGPLPIDLGIATARGCFEVSYESGQPDVTVFKQERALAAFLIRLLARLQALASVPAIDYNEYGRSSRLVSVGFSCATRRPAPACPTRRRGGRCGHRHP